MALFNLTDISFKAPSSVTGPLRSLTESKEYARNTYRYPSDLGSSDKAHYIVININVQRKTSFPYEQAKDTPQYILNQQKYGTAGATNLLPQAAGALEYAGSLAKNAVDSVAGVFPKTTQAIGRTAMGKIIGQTTAQVVAEAKAFNNELKEGTIRASKRTTDTVALYMPDTVAFSHSQAYSDIRPGGEALTALAAAGFSAADAIQSGGTLSDKTKKVIRNLSPFLVNMLAKQAGALGQIAFSAGYGVVQNPMIELLYSSPSLRTFRFDFQFYPRSEKEAEEVQNIIQRLRYHQAPEVFTNFGNGYFMVPPSEFDISFYHNGIINPNIPQISTCVLEQLDVDYAPGGFSAYEVPNQKAKFGGTGMPVAIRLGLQFKETEIMTKASFNNQTSAAKGVGDARALEIIEQRPGDALP
jgi:hypothetical protein